MRRFRSRAAMPETGWVADLLSMTADLPTVTVPQGAVVVEEGAPAGRMLVMVSGRVVIEHAEVPFARIDSPGAVFGEMSVVLDRPADEVPAITIASTESAVSTSQS